MKRILYGLKPYVVTSMSDDSKKLFKIYDKILNSFLISGGFKKTYMIVCYEYKVRFH